MKKRGVFGLEASEITRNADSSHGRGGGAGVGVGVEVEVEGRWGGCHLIPGITVVRGRPSPSPFSGGGAVVVYPLPIGATYFLVNPIMKPVLTTRDDVNFIQGDHHRSRAAINKKNRGARQSREIL